MSPCSRARLGVGVAICLGGALVMFSPWAAAQQPTNPADDPRFTGISTVLEPTDLSVARRRFEPGARSAWHSHDRGQLLYVEQGRMRTQKRGQKKIELGPGWNDYTGPKVEHWHGATPDTHLIQVNVGFGGETRWRSRTTDDEYAGRQ
ncbi:MAG: cupin domain-containing protein [Acidobacteriota bacterium]